jgi:hypothetical protein
VRPEEPRAAIYRETSSASRVRFARIDSSHLHITPRYLITSIKAIMSTTVAMPELAPPSKAYTAQDILALPNNGSTAPFMKDLKEKGYCVIPNLVAKEKCDQYVNDALTWLENFGMGFKRDDKSTWTKDHLPVHAVGGLYNRYGESGLRPPG